MPKPKDWPENCEVVGFINVELKKLTQYEPDQALKDFLAAGDLRGRKEKSNEVGLGKGGYIECTSYGCT